MQYFLIDSDGELSYRNTLKFMINFVGTGFTRGAWNFSIRKNALSFLFFRKTNFWPQAIPKVPL